MLQVQNCRVGSAALAVNLCSSRAAGVQEALIRAGGIQALDLLVESGEPRVAARSASVLAQIDPEDFAAPPGAGKSVEAE